jgi:hypothetical protein
VGVQDYVEQSYGSAGIHCVLLHVEHVCWHSLGL